MLNISGEMTIDGKKFGQDIDLAGMNENQQVKEVESFMLGMRATILTELNIGDYKAKGDA